MENLITEQEIKVLQQYLHVHPDSEIHDILEARIKELKTEITNSAEFVKEIVVTDPDSKAPVEISVFKHGESGAMFAIDSSYLDQCFDDDQDPVIPDPFNAGTQVTLYNL